MTKRSSSRKQRSRQSRIPRRLEFESLEPRRMLAQLFVTTLDDVVDPADGLISLREAVDTANANGESDVIKFKRQARQGTVTLDPSLGELDITEDLKIQGSGAKRLTISGDGQSRVFHVYPEVTASFASMTISNGLAFDAPGYGGPVFAFGGGIYNQGAEVSLFRVQMKNNQAGILDGNGNPVVPVAAGGAVANEFGGVLTVSHSTFVANSALGLLTGVGGAITSDRGDSSFGTGEEPNPSPSPVVNISHSRFYDNTVSNAFGPTPELPVLSGFALGGALLNLAGSMDVTHSVFHGNQALAGAENVDGPSIGRGGAIFSMDFTAFGSADSTLSVSHSAFHGNTAIGGSSTTGVGGEATGGAIAGLEGTEVAVNHSTFIGNQAIGGQGVTGGNGTGGAIGVDVFASLVPDPFPTLNVAHSKFMHNQAIGGDNGGTGRGGAIAGLSGSVMHLNRDFLAGNRAIGGDGGGDGQGGGVYNGANSVATMKRSFVMHNHAVGGSGGIGQGGGLFNDLGEDDDTEDDGQFELDAFTEFFTRFNFADDGDDFFGF